MKGRDRICHVLAAAGSEEHVRTINQIIRGVPPSPFDLRIARAFSLAQIRQGVSGAGLEAPADILVAEMPLRDRTGVEEILDLAGRNRDLQIVLLVRQEVYEQVIYQSRNLPVFVLAMPVKRQILAETVSYMLKVKGILTERDRELLRLRKNLGELTIITRAKIYLMQNRGMNEEEAHYFLEKEAMDKSLTKREIAEEILR